MNTQLKLEVELGVSACGVAVIVILMPTVYECAVKCKNDFLSKQANKQEAHVAKGAVEFLGLKCNNQSNKLPYKMIQALGQRVVDICIMGPTSFIQFTCCCCCCAYYLFVFIFFVSVFSCCIFDDFVILSQMCLIIAWYLFRLWLKLCHVRVNLYPICVGHHQSLHQRQKFTDSVCYPKIPNRKRCPQREI